jgi:hypothetical protein
MAFFSQKTHKDKLEITQLTEFHFAEKAKKFTKNMKYTHGEYTCGISSL